MGKSCLWEHGWPSSFPVFQFCYWLVLLSCLRSNRLLPFANRGVLQIRILALEIPKSGASAVHQCIVTHSCLLLCCVCLVQSSPFHSTFVFRRFKRFQYFFVCRIYRCTWNFCWQRSTGGRQRRWGRDFEILKQTHSHQSNQPTCSQQNTGTQNFRRDNFRKWLITKITKFSLLRKFGGIQYSKYEQNGILEGDCDVCLES